MSSQETKKSAAKFGKFGSKKSSASFKVPKLIKPSESSNGDAPAISVDARPAPKAAPLSARNDRGDTDADRTEELPEEELLDENDLEPLDDGELEDDGEVTQASPDMVSGSIDEPLPAGSVDVAGEVTSGSIDAPPATVKMPASKRPVDPYGATAAIGPEDVEILRAHKAAADANADGIVAGELPGISADPLAASRPNTADDEAAAVAALDGLDELGTVEDSLVGMQAQRQQQMASAPPQQMASPPPGVMSPVPGSVPAPMYGTPPPGQMSPVPGALSPVPGALSPVPGSAASSGPFPAVHTPYPNHGAPPQAAPAPGSMEAARNASWKTAHPSARRWAKRRDNTNTGGRRTPSPSRIGAGLILIGIGIYLLAIFIPAHRPDGPRESERTEAGKVWRFSETQHSLAAALAFGFAALGLFGAVRGAVYRREVVTGCKSCQMKVEATREGLVLRCHNGGHKAGLAVSSIGMLAAFVIIGGTTLILLLSASLG